MEARIVRGELQKCYRGEGVNQLQNCKELAEKYAGMIRDNKVGSGSVLVVARCVILVYVVGFDGGSMNRGYLQNGRRPGSWNPFGWSVILDERQSRDCGNRLELGHASRWVSDYNLT